MTPHIPSHIQLPARTSKSIVDKMVRTGMVICLIALGFSGTLVLGYQWFSAKQSMKENHTALARMIAHNVEGSISFDDPEDAAGVLMGLGEMPHVFYAAVLRPSGDFLATYQRTHNPMTPLTLPTETGSFFREGILLTKHDIMLDGKPIGAVCLQSDMTLVTGTLWRNGLVLMISVFLALLVAWLFAPIIQRAIISPILQMAGLAQRIAQEKDYSIRTVKTHDDEIGILSDAFNEMLSQIDRQDQTLRQLHGYLANIINSMPSALVGVDRNGSVTQWNIRAAEWTGVSVDEAMNQDFRNLWPDILGSIGDITPVMDNRKPKAWTTGPALGNADGPIHDITVYPLITNGVDGAVIRVDDITERKKAEVLIQQSEDRFYKAFFSSPIAMVISEIDSGRFIEVNKRFLNMLEYTRDEVIGHTSAELRIWIDITCREKVARVIRTQRSIADVPTAFRTKSDKIRHIEWSAEIISMGNQEVLLSILYDVTERKAMEDALRNSERRFRTLADGAPIMIAVCDSNMNFTFQNRDWLHFFGPNITSASDHNEQIHPDDCDEVLKKIENAQNLSKRYAIEYRVRNQAGIYRWVLNTTTPLSDDAAGHTGYLITAVDITNRKDNESLIRSNEANLRATLNSIGDAVIATDQNGLVVRMNPVAENYLQKPVDEAVGTPIDHLLTIVNGETRANVSCPVSRILKTGETVGLTNHLILVANNVQDRHIAMSGSPIRNDANMIIGVVLVLRDVSREYDLQAQLFHAQKMDAIGQLAGGIAHDFNNMLGGIINASDLLLRRPDGMNDLQRNMLHLVNDTAHRAAELTQKLLTFSRKGKISTTILDLHDMIIKTVELLQHTIDRRIELETSFTAESSIIRGDMASIQNIFLNLGINASHAMPDGGRISFQTRIVHLGEHDCKSEKFHLEVGDYIEVAVMDNGRGIDPIHLPHIFEPFYSTKEQGKGTGLGLPVVYGSMLAHKGAITVYSDPGKGTAFHLLFPLVGDAEAQHHNEPEQEAISGHGCILVIDDEHAIRISVDAVLRDLGYDVLLAEDGSKGVEVYMEHHDHIDLVLLDMSMPQMNGRECVQHLKKINPDVGIIIASGFLRSEEMHAFKKDGVKAVMRKPYRLVELSWMIDACMRNDTHQIETLSKHMNMGR